MKSFLLNRFRWTFSKVFMGALALIAISACSKLPSKGALSSQTPVYTVTYNGNGSTGGVVPSDNTSYSTGETVTVLTAGSMVKTGGLFNGWNTAADGSGTRYASSATFSMGSADVTLYAQWLDPGIYVSTSGDDASGSGTPTAPYATISKAITEAGVSETIRVAAGTYSESSTMDLKEGMQLLGGYDPQTWARDISSNESKIDFTSNAGFSVRLVNLTGTQLIEGFTFEYINTDNNAMAIGLLNSPNTDVKRNTFKLRGGNGTAVAVEITGDYQGTVSGNYINASFGSGRYVEGISLGSMEDGSEVKVFNNVINTSSSASNGSPFGIKIDDSPGKTYALIVRNNTFIGGVDSTEYSAAVGEMAVNDGGTVNLSFDNNIVFCGGAPGGKVSGIYFNSTTIASYVSVKNNNFFNFDTILTDDRQTYAYTTPTALETGLTAAVASSNIALEMIAADYFEDEANGDYRLSNTAPASISQGGLDGSALGWGFTDDFAGVTRTGDGTTGWSMGAYEL